MLRVYHLGIAVALIGIAVLSLWLMGRPWGCKCGSLNPWSGETLGIHNSQHLFDPYTFTHVLHGIGFYGLLWLFRDYLSPVERGVVAIGLEAAWEVVENTRLVIEKYRAETISLGYYGDSILNSLGDIAACLTGYLLALFAPAWLSLVAFLGIEAALLWWIRDSLLLNILMLLRPIEAIKDWQIRR